MASGEDRISGLPDELLHAILFCVRSARDAVRTSVLSGRWRHILVRPLPELVFEEGLGEPAPPQAPPPLESFLDNVDAAIATCDAPVLKRLCIMWRGPLPTAAASRLPTSRVEPWLRLASERVVGDLHLHVFSPGRLVDGDEAVLELPLCEWVKSINLKFGGRWRIRPPSAGLFRALASLTIWVGRMDGSELTSLVCTQCPGLRNLNLYFVLVDAFDISIGSKSLQSLDFSVLRTQRLEIVAPELEKLFIRNIVDEVRLTAPKLQELAWPIYHPICHKFDDVGRRLRMLDCGKNAYLMQQFDEVDELRLDISIPQEIFGYKRFLNETNRLPKYNLLNISLNDRHALVPSMLHLLRSCNSTRNVSLNVECGNPLEHPCLPACPCLLEESYRIDDIFLNSLEKVEITSYTSADEVVLEFVEFVERLSRCNASNLKKVVIMWVEPAPPPTKEVCQKIRNVCQPNIEVGFAVLLDQELVLLD